jgi:hypothetical protein
MAGARVSAVAPAKLHRGSRRRMGGLGRRRHRTCRSTTDRCAFRLNRVDAVTRTWVGTVKEATAGVDMRAAVSVVVTTAETAISRRRDTVWIIPLGRV